MEWTIEYYSQAVEGLIMDMPAGIKARYYAISNRMKAQGPNLGMPYVKPLGGGIYEIRAKGPEGQGRVFYCTIRVQTIIILHGFIKKTQAIRKRELDIARRRMREVKNERTGKGR
ncbi:MAG: type II toxin-antitoxin system RelE/ParE family toxin [Syntrophobacteraceae bacterium]|jgi:phage-related protein